MAFKVKGDAEVGRRLHADSLSSDTAIDVTVQASAPSSPTAGRYRLYASNDGKFYYRDSIGTIVPLAGGTAIVQQIITLSAPDIANKYHVLDLAPFTKENTKLTVVFGPEQLYGTDFVVTSDDTDKRLSWDSLGLDGVLQDGEKIIVCYDIEV